jgi:hypothetical protein
MDTLFSILISLIEVILTMKLLKQGFYKPLHYIMLMMAAIFIIIVIQLCGWDYKTTPSAFYVVDLFLMGSLYTMWKTAKKEVEKRDNKVMHELLSTMTKVGRPGTNKSSTIEEQLQKGIKARDNIKWRYQRKIKDIKKQEKGSSMIFTAIMFICFCGVISGMYKLISVGSISVGHGLVTLVSFLIILIFCRPTNYKSK